MSGGENFLARWVRRKAAATELAKPAPAREAEAVAEPPPSATTAAASPVELPPIDSINAMTDVAPFLAPGVSADLTRAALRRAWATDPAIRDFVGLCENGWDFTAVDGVPGFGALSSDEVKRLVAELTREPDPIASASGPPAAQPQSSPVAPESNAAVQQDENEEKSSPLPLNRRHGGALPQ